MPEPDWEIITDADLPRLTEIARAYRDRKASSRAAAASRFELPEEQALREFRARARGEDVKFIDVVFAPHKSVSVLWAGFLAARRDQDAQRVQDAHHEAVHAAIDCLQNELGIGRDGARYLPIILKLFTLAHIASDRDRGDPHLHTHVIVDTEATGCSHGAEGRPLPLHRENMSQHVTLAAIYYERELHRIIDQRLGIVLAAAPPPDHRRHVPGITEDETGGFADTACGLGFRQMIAKP